ncbi:MAG: response regulator transcription factor [Clostridia bacterium]|nr:response regulator transcription factor [Clostridia bacterium]
MSNNKYKILVCEDDKNIRSVVATVLETNGYQVIVAGSCAEAEMMASSYVPDLVILDLGLPDRDGTEFIRNARSHSGVPILVLSARTGERDKIEALDMGATDYITKPFGTGELVARVRAALRTVKSVGGVVSKGVFELNGMVIDYGRRLVTIDGEEIKLTQTEYNILDFMSHHTGQVMTYTSIINEIWGHSDLNAIKKLQVNMANLRKKMGTKPGDNRFIINELGVGYRIQDPM